jgi:hypothetical protein
MFDVPTLAFCAALVSVLLGLGLHWFSRVLPIRDGFQRWTHVVFPLAAGVLLFGLRGVVPDVLSIPLSNGLILLALASAVDSIRRFTRGTAHALWRDYAIPLLGMAFSSVFRFVEDDQRLRVAGFSVLTALLALRAARLLWTSVRHHAVVMERGASVLFALVGVGHLVRGVVSLGQLRTGDTMLPTWVTAASMVSGIVMMMAWTFAMMVMALQRAAHAHHVPGVLPICATCKDIRDDEGYWQQLEAYLGKSLALRFTHGICPDCAEEFLKDE